MPPRTPVPESDDPTPIPEPRLPSAFPRPNENVTVIAPGDPPKPYTPESA